MQLCTLIFRKRSCKDEVIGNRYKYHNKYINKVFFHGNICFICKGTESVDSGMDNNAGEQTSATIKNRYKQEAYRNRKANLAQIAYQVHVAAIK